VGGQGLFSGKKVVTITGADFCTKNLDDLKNFLALTHPKG